MLASLFALPRTSRAELDDISIGALTFASVGAVGAIVSGFGSFSHIAHGEHSGWWGWLALASGASLTGGAIVLADREPDAGAAASVAIALGAFTMVTGIVGLVLPSAETKRRRQRPWLVMPTIHRTRGKSQTAVYGLTGLF